MSQVHTVMTIFAVLAAAGIIGTVGVFLATAQSADAWHSSFERKKECVNFFKRVVGNTTAQSNIICQRIIPH